MSHSRTICCCYLYFGISLSHRHCSHPNSLQRWLVLPYIRNINWWNCRCSCRFLMSFRNIFSSWWCHIMHCLHIGLPM